MKQKIQIIAIDYEFKKNDAWRLYIIINKADYFNLFTSLYFEQEFSINFCHQFDLFIHFKICKTQLFKDYKCNIIIYINNLLFHVTGIKILFLLNIYITSDIIWMTI